MQTPASNGHSSHGDRVSTSEDVANFTFYDSDSEEEFHLQLNPTRKWGKPLARPIAAIAITKDPTPGKVVESSAAVYVNTGYSKPITNGKKAWRLLD